MAKGRVEVHSWATGFGHCQPALSGQSPRCKVHKNHIALVTTSSVAGRLRNIIGDYTIVFDDGFGNWEKAFGSLLNKVEQLAKEFEEVE